MNIVEKVKKCKTYTDLVAIIYDMNNDDLKTPYSYEHFIFILDKIEFHHIYKSINDIHDFNEFNVKYEEYVKEYKKLDIFYAFIEYANSYLLINDIEDTYKFTTVYNEMFIVCYKVHVVIFTFIRHKINFTLILGYNNMVIHNIAYSDISDFETLVRNYKLKYIENL